MCFYQEHRKAFESSYGVGRISWQTIQRPSAFQSKSDGYNQHISQPPQKHILLAIVLPIIFASYATSSFQETFVVNRLLSRPVPSCPLKIRFSQTSLTRYWITVIILIEGYECAWCLNLWTIYSDTCYCKRGGFIKLGVFIYSILAMTSPRLHDLYEISTNLV